MEEFDLVIVGAGPAGLMAAVYAARYKLKTIVFGEVQGGTISEAHLVCNFPTYKEIPGYEISQKMIDQVTSLGVPIVMERVEKVIKKNDKFIVKNASKEYKAKKVIIAIGTKRRRLDIPRENELKGRGVSYCSACDGPFFKDKIVGVVGGSDAALSAAVQLSDIAKKVYVIHRKNNFSKAEPIWVEIVEKNSKIKPVFDSNVVELIGKERLTGVKLDSGKEIKLDGLFIEIGSIPQEEFLNSMGLKLDEWGYVLTDSKMRTNVKGLFTAGDLNSGNFKQAVVSVAEGAVAVNTAYNEIKCDVVKDIKRGDCNG